MKTTDVTSLLNIRLLVCIFLLVSLGTSVFANRNIKFSVDLSLLVSQGKFNPNTDAVYIKGTFNSWGSSNILAKGNNNIYSATLSLADYSYHEYKYFITSAGAANGGWENNFPVAVSGNRPIALSVNDLVLQVMYFNDADMDQFKTTAHFNFHYTSQENAIIDDYSTKLEMSFERITAALQTTVPDKIEIYIYKNLGTFHLAVGYPEMADWGTGTAFGKRLITVLSPTQVGYNGAVDVLIHEFTHVVEAWKTKVILPAWLNEGVACYYGRKAPESFDGQTNSKTYIKNLITQSGKPNIEQVFNGNEGYTWSASMAYFIITTKGEAAMAKFVENMNYTDIGYTGITALQIAWWNFLDAYVNTQVNQSIKFSVDMADMIKYGYFDPGTNHVFVRGGFNGWGSTQLSLENGTIYSANVPIRQYYFVEYKFFVDNSLAPSGGWESDFTGGYCTNRLINVATTAMTLTTPKFNFPIPNIDLNKLILRSFTSNEIRIAGDTTEIGWELTNVANINIEFSDDNGSNWQTVLSNIGTSSKKTNWVVSNSISSQCKIKITDASNSSNYDESDQSFRIVNPNEAGGPYLFDKNTIALFHFDNNLNNRSNLSANATGNTLNITSNAGLLSDLGNCISTSAPVTVPHSTTLNLTGDWTIEAWVKFTAFSSNSYMSLINKPSDSDPLKSNYSLQLNPFWGNKFYGFYFSGPDYRVGATSSSPVLNEWYHVAFIRDTKQSKLQMIVRDKNRKIVSINENEDLGTTPYLNTQSLVFGSGVTGFMDEVRISNVVRGFINTGIKETANKEVFSIYPNPSNGNIHIIWPKGLSKGQIRVMDITGKTVYTNLLPNSSDNTLNLNHLKKGIYLIQLTDNKSIWTEKVILN
ncbi:MAG: T9SS type A sorting domain-containing protein [Bacteroidales bacterium]|nr:T9SS type A sorting domain-containing protein [Bacteroidales bacterium]